MANVSDSFGEADIAADPNLSWVELFRRMWATDPAGFVRACAQAGVDFSAFGGGSDLDFSI
jgi:hypothetical protein